MTYFVTISFWVLILSSFTAKAQNSIELSCRSQAKEIAVQTYQSCVTQARASRVDQIRKDYQAKLSELKAYYDQELKSVVGQDRKSIAGSRKRKSTPKNMPQPAVVPLPEKTVKQEILPMTPPPPSTDTPDDVAITQEIPAAETSPLQQTPVAEPDASTDFH